MREEKEKNYFFLFLLPFPECSKALAPDLDAAVRFGALLSVARAPRCVAARLVRCGFIVKASVNSESRQPLGLVGSAAHCRVFSGACAGPRCGSAFRRAVVGGVRDASLPDSLAVASLSRCRSTLSRASPWGWSALLLVSECAQALAPDLEAAVRFGALLSVACAMRRCPTRSLRLHCQGVGQL